MSGAQKISKFGSARTVLRGRSHRADSLEVDENEILVEGVGKSVEEAIELLSLCGLNDAFLFLRRFKELSDGQKYRYKLAKLARMCVPKFHFSSVRVGCPFQVMLLMSQGTSPSTEGASERFFIILGSRSTGFAGKTSFFTKIETRMRAV